MFAASVLATPLLTNVPVVPEVHVPAPVSLPTVEPLQVKLEAEVEPVQA